MTIPLSRIVVYSVGSTAHARNVVLKRKFAKEPKFKNSFKKGMSCFICGYDKNWHCLDFARIDRDDKLTNSRGKKISPSTIMSKAIFDAELEKMVLFCKNCHALETYAEIAVERTGQIADLYNLINTEKEHRGGCMDCKVCVEDDNYPMFHFDHLPEFEKLYEISAMARRGQPKDIIRAEMAKCELRCANCHGLKTEERAGRSTAV